MRLLVIILTLICISSPFAFGKSGADFDEFVKSREVVATLYFQSNNENLDRNELKHLAETINKLRKLQEDGRMIRVEGFSSPEGDQEENFRLSFFRARSVAVLIEAKGLPAEVTLTGYGDLFARSDDPNKERRVEIASYLKPVGMKKVKVAKKENNSSSGSDFDAIHVAPNEQGIDSYRVDQAIRRKIDNKNKGLADKNKTNEGESLPSLSQTDINVDYTNDLDHAYNHWRKSVDPTYSPKLSQSSKTVDSALKHGYSQLEKSNELKMSPGVTQITADKSFVIDALMIEQVIMEKIGAASLPPSGTVSQANTAF